MDCYIFKIPDICERILSYDQNRISFYPLLSLKLQKLGSADFKRRSVGREGETGYLKVENLMQK